MASHDTGDGGAAGKKAGEPIKCVVVTPERTLFDELVEFVALPLYDGELGVLPGRAPLIGRLGFGELRTQVHGATKRYFVDGGFAQVRDDVVTVLTNRAVPSGQIDTAAAAKELEIAQSRRATSDYEVAEKNKAVARARAQIHIGAAR
ncbi:MAG: ATP synthase F1 subunit epsilon [Isosphaeraceae bacterium]|nr:ATP synthase F1 subunit epsilon [Isosphaeraceae bacterium]